MLKKFFTLLTTTLLALLLAGCGQDKLQPLADNAVILAFGDSLTEGKGVKRSESYPAVLQDLSGRTVINAGVSGEITDNGLPRLHRVLQQQTADLLILMHGGNDILRNQSMEKARDNLAAMIELAGQHQIPVLLVGVPEKQLFSSTAPHYRELAEQYDLVFIDDTLSKLLKSPEHKSDQVHLNKAGYRKLAEAIYQTLKDNGAL